MLSSKAILGGVSNASHLSEIREAFKLPNKSSHQLWHFRNSFWAPCDVVTLLEKIFQMLATEF